MKITIVAGARPNFIKIAPIIKAIEKKQNEGIDISYRLIHTGQHYDKNLSDTFFRRVEHSASECQFEVKAARKPNKPVPLWWLLKKSYSNILVIWCWWLAMSIRLWPVLSWPKKSHIKVTHVEAGIRSGDMTMPEEINRIVTDSITDYFSLLLPQLRKTYWNTVPILTISILWAT